MDNDKNKYINKSGVSKILGVILLTYTLNYTSAVGYNYYYMGLSRVHHHTMKNTKEPRKLDKSSIFKMQPRFLGVAFNLGSVCVVRSVMTKF